ncbi:MAG: PepSY-associated TM helix domain-containing protein [Gemmatimonadaceae bacterium]
MHRVLGLGAGIVLIVTGLTGSTLVFRQEIDSALNPHLLVVAPTAERAPLQAVLERVVASYPGDEAPARIRMPQRADGTYEFWLGAAPSRYVYADPYSGALLGTRRPTEFLTGWLFLLHSHMLAGEVGHVVAGVAGLILIVLSISGLVVWWPRRAPWHAWRQWRQSLTIARGSGAARTTYDLHRVIGFYASALLLLAGVTGASLVFPKAFERAAFWVTASTPPAPPLPPLASPVDEAPLLPLDSLLAIAERAQPGGAISYLYLPAAPGQEFGVRKRLPGEKHPNGKSFVHVEPTTGRVLGVEDGARAARGGRLYSILYPLHIGILGGTATRLLAMAAGLSLPLLACTGALVWWRRGRRGRRAGDGRAAARRTPRA